MDLPASYYGKLDKKNPVISSFERDISSFTALMRRAASSFGQDKSHAKGIKILTEIWRNYKHRLPPKFYQERMLQVADFLYGLKLYQVALWQGYSLHLRHFSSVKITDITDVDHFMACFFPGGFDTDQDILGMKIRAMLGCALCIFELEKRHSVLSQKGLSKLLHVLNFIRILMQACQQHDHLCWHLYNGSLHIYSICRYLMTVNCSAQALEYLLWASISLELSIPLMTPENLSWLVTLYCAVCHCYYDNQAAVQAEEFARRALGKVNDLAELEKESGVPPSRETQITFKEATIKVRVPRTTTEHILMSLFDSSAAQFLAILEALWDSSAHPLQMRAPDEPEVQEVVRELLSAGISILTGFSSDDHNRVSFNTSTSTLMDLAITGENKVHITSAVRFLKLLFHYKQQDVFSKLARQMLQVLSGVEGHSFKKAELELALLDRFNSLQSSQKSCTREDPINNERCKSSFLKSSEEFTGLVDILHKSVCGFAPKSRSELLQMECEVVEKGLKALSKSVATLLPQGSSSVIDFAFMQKFGAITSASSPMSEEGYREHKTNRTGGEVENKVESDEKSAPHIQAVYVSQLATDLLHELDIIHHRASVKLLHLNAVAESELWDRIKENKVSKALLLIQKALLVYNNMEPNNSSKTKSLLEEASTLIEKAGMEEKKLYMSNDPKTPAEDKVKTEEKENPPPPPILVSRTNCSFIFIPAPYHMEEQVCWYQLFGRAAEGINNKVRLRDCSLQGTGDLVPAVSGECMLKVEGLESNHKYVFAVAAYNSQGMLVGSTIGGTTLPLLACMPLPLLSSWAHLAQVAFQTEQYVIAKTACRELWSHYTSSGTGSNNPQSRLATTELHVQTLRCSSPLLCQLFLTSIFIETQINIQQASLYCDSAMGLFIWEQEARLAECERMLVAMDLAMWLNDSSAAVQAVVSCYGLLVPLIFHQIPCYPVAQVLTKCLIVLEENSVFLKQKLPGNTSESLMHMLACLTYYLSKSRTVHPAAVKTELKRSPQLKALNVKSKKMITLDRTHSAGNEILHPRSGPEDPSMFYDQISSGTLKDASQYVMKLGRKACFIECAALLLLRAMEEGQPDFVLKSGQAIFEVLSRERLAVEKMLTSMSSIVQRHKKQLQLRSMCFEESVWRASLNYSLAQAHLLLYYQGLDQQLGGVLQDRYSQINPVSFSLAYSGVLVQWRSSQWQRSYKYGVASEIDSSHSGVHDYEISVHKSRNTKAAPDDSYTDNSCEETDDISQSDEQQYEMHGHHPALLLDSLKKAALHLRRAMVLAHRGSHWTTLQSVCQTVWEQSSRLVELEERVSHFKPSFLNTAEQLHNIFAPLLVLATDLVMDMLNRLELWSLYDKLTEEELESSLHFSAPLDESTRVDLRWVCTLVLHTLEILHDNGKWESLAHFALLFNSYTRERYTLAVTPLLVVAQRKLLVRIGAFGGPTVPQPHHSKTQRATGMEVAYRSYAGCKLLSGWTPHPAQQPETPLTPRDITELRDAEMKHSLSLVRVPLVVEDTLCHYRKALERRPHCLQVFQHSRSLLLLLLAYTQPCFAAQLQRCKSRSLLSSSVVGFSPIVMTAPEIRPCDLTEENYSTPNSLYSLPISPDHVPKITAAYTTTIKYLQANNHESLHILALHEMGNLQFYDRNTGAAHSYWSKALDTALQSSGVLEKWDGVSLGGCTFQQTLKQAGLWRCLQAAGLSAKIAQYTLTSDISQRTRCCLLSAYLFKCVLCCSLARPQADLQYSSYCIGDELLPGVDLFSAPHRVHLGTTVAGLNFICQWLFITGYHMTLLPMLALYLHFVGSVCRDMQRTVEARILKIRALTELCLFTEAIKETLQLTQGTGVPLPNEPTQDNLQPVKMFCSNKSLWDNTEALEELVNCEFAPEVSSLYGSTLQLRFHLARIQLVLALSSTVHGHPVPACSVNSELHEQDKLDPEDSCHEKQKTKVLVLDSDKEKTTPERIKFLLLEGAAVLLNSLDLTSQSHGKTETLELTIQSNLLKANLYLQQGQAALSSEMAASCLALLQSSPLVMRRSIPGSGELAAELPPVRTTTEQGTKDHSESDPLHGDCPREVEASERIGGALWLHCRMALFRSLAAQIHDTAVRFPVCDKGKNITEVAAEVLQQGLHECARLGEVDIQSLLMVEGAELQALRGRSDDSMALLQEAVCLLSGQTCMPPGSSVTLARATLLLSHLRETQSAVLLKLTQKVLQKQLWDFGVNVVLVDGKMCLSPPGLSNIYLPYLHILEQTTLQKGQG
ncbi:cilia- and flagella-associated protein 54 [Aulostomus maculatus]